MIYDPAPAKRVDFNGGDDMTVSRTVSSPCNSNNRSRVAQEPIEANKSLMTAGVFDAQKSRYTGASSAMVFPRILSAAFGSDTPPKEHSFAYNFGIRPEEISNTHGLLENLISEKELESFSGIYFSALAPIADVLEPKAYAQRCWDYYHGSGSTMVAFGAVAAGVAALGSFISPNGHPQESNLVQYAKAILDDPASIRKLSIDHIMAWAMRVLYLRATTRPNNAWIASCTAMHLCETIGLHEEGNIRKMASITGVAIDEHYADQLRRLFWCLWAGHSLLSYECDRSAVQFSAVTCQAIISRPGSVADQFVQIAQIIPSPNSPFQLESQPSTAGGELFERLMALNKLQSTNPFLLITKADLAFCFYRRVYQLRMGIPDEFVQLVIDSGNAAVRAAEQLANQGCLFWNVIGSVFQYTCVLLAIDTPDAAIHIKTAFHGLENFVRAADTGLTCKALSMARHLLKLKMAEKRKQLEHLEAVEANCQYFETQPEIEANATVLDVDWGEFWDEFLTEPYLSMLNSDIQLQGTRLN